LLDLDQDFSVLYGNYVGLDGNHAGWRDDLPGADIELAPVKIAFDHLTLEGPVRQRSGSMGAGIVGNKELPRDIENGERQSGSVNPEGAALIDFVGTAEFDAGRSRVHGRRRE